MLQTARLFLFILCIVFISFSVQKASGQSNLKRDTSFQSSITYGLHGGVPFLMTDAQYSGYNSVPTCCPTVFGSKSVLSLFPALGLSIEYNFIDILSFQIKPNVLQFGSKLIAEETVLVNNNGTPVPVIVDHSMDNNLLGIGADFSLIFKPTSNLRIGAGVSVHSLMTSTFVQEERIRDEANFAFLGSNRPIVRNRQEGTIPNVNKLPLSILGSLGYAIAISPEFQLVPEVSFNYALSSFANELIVQNKNFQTTQDGSFKVNALRLGIALLYNPTITEEIKLDEVPKPNQDSILLAQENERKRLEEERITKEKIEKENIAKSEQTEKERIAKEEKERIEKESLAKAERENKERIEKETKAKENLTKEDKDRLAREERERIAKEKADKEALAKAEREEKDRLAREERERLAKEKADKVALVKAEREEKERLAKVERERIEKERLANENLTKAERDKLAREERERLAKEKADKEALAKAEREEKDRLAREERERLAQEKAYKEALTKAERAEKDRLAREERERLAQEKASKEALVKAEREEKDRLAREERERIAKEKADKEALANAERVEKDRLAREEREKLTKEKADKEAFAKAERERLALAEAEKNTKLNEQQLLEEQDRKIAQEKKKEAERVLAEEERLKLEKTALELEKKKDIEAKEKERLRAEKEAKQEDINTSPECIANSSKPILLVEGIAKKYNAEKPTAAKSAIVFENIITNNTICLVATEKGKFKVPVVDASTHYGFYAKKNGYFSTSQNIPIEVVSNQEQKLPPPPVTLFKVTDMEENVLTEPIVLNNVFFKFNKPDLSVKAYSELDRLAELLLSNEKVRVEIHGFVSKVEYDREFNKEKRKLLSSGRAKAVLDYLKSKGVKRSSMRVADEATISIEPNPLSLDSKESAEQAMCINLLFFGK